MSDRTNHIEQLLAKWHNNSLSADERKELLSLLENTSLDDALTAYSKKIWDRNDQMQLFSETEIDQILNTALETESTVFVNEPSENENGNQFQPSRQIKRYMGVAASLLIVLGSISIYKTVRDRNATYTSGRQKVSLDSSIANTATLTLANGSHVQLNPTGNGTFQDENTTVQKAGKELIYISSPTTAGEKYNVLTTPSGTQFGVTLPDGSKVCLNAMSSIKFPLTFTDNERMVEVTGELYFEIAPDSRRPFKVKSQNQQIEVLGTTFNLNSYAEEGTTKTTLITGSIRIKTKEQQQLLSPGQQTILRKNQLFLNKKANIEKALEWKNGIFSYEDMSIYDIAKHLHRWYNVNVIVPQHHSDRFTGEMKITQSLSEVLNNLERTGTINFNVKGTEVTVIFKTPPTD